MYVYYTMYVQIGMHLCDYMYVYVCLIGVHVNICVWVFFYGKQAIH